jgi:MoxR-like ATPase
VTPEQYAATAAAIEAEVGRVIVGQRDLVRAALVCLLCEGHLLIEGVPGLGKTMLLKTLAAALDVHLARVQFTPDLMPADIVGTTVIERDPSGATSFAFKPGPIFANLVLADEINRATPKTQSALLEAMQERSVTVAGETRLVPRPFLVMATQNPIEQEGTYPLPEAQLDRFLLKALVPFPTADELVEVIDRTTGGTVAAVEQVADGATLREMIALTPQVPIAPHLVRHAADLVVATHPDGANAPAEVRQYVRTGASPRGAQALVMAGKVTALLDGRPSVAADDLRALAPAVLRHRVLTGYDAVADGVSADAIVAAVLAAVGPPGTNVRGAP